MNVEINFKNKVLIKDFIVFGLGNIGSKAILFFLVPLYTNYLTTDEYGISDLITVASSLIASLLTVDIHASLLRFALSKSERKENVARVSMLVCICSSVIAICISPLFALYEPLAPYRWYIVLLIIITGYRNTAQVYLKVAERNRALSVIGVCETAVLAVLNIILLRFFSLGVDGYLAANIVAYAFFVLAGVIVSGYMTDALRGTLGGTLIKEMLLFALVGFFDDIIWWVNMNSGKIMIQFFVNTSVLGIYTAASRIPALINIVTGVFNQAWGLSSIREIEGDRDEGFFSRIFIYLSMVVTGMGILFIAISKPLVTILMGKSFHEAMIYTPVLLAGTVFYAIEVYFESLYVAIKKLQNSFITNLIGCLINVLVSFLLSKTYGIWGAVVGYSLGFFIISVLRIIDMERYIHLEYSRVRYWGGMVVMMLLGGFVAWDRYIIPASIVAIVIYLCLYGRELCRVIGKLYRVIHQMLSGRGDRG